MMFSLQDNLVVTVLLGLIWGIVLGNIKLQTSKFGNWLYKIAPYIAYAVLGLVIIALLLIIANIDYSSVFMIISFIAFFGFIVFLYFKVKLSTPQQKKKKNSMKRRN